MTSRKTATFTPHEDYKKRKCDDNEDTISTDELAEMFQLPYGHGVRDVDPN